MRLVTSTIFITLFASAAVAGGANSPLTRSKAAEENCAPGFYWDARDGLCIAANWR